MKQLLQSCLLSFALACTALCGTVASAADPLPPDRAFRLSAQAIDDRHVEVRVAIEPGYYLYRDKFRFTAAPPATAVGTPQYPTGESHTDAFFGTQTVFRDALRVVLPVDAPVGEPFELKVVHQGCADLGVCYPPSTIPVKLSMLGMSVAPGASAGGLNTAPAFGAPAPMMDTAPANAPSLNSAAPSPEAGVAIAPRYEDDSARVARLLRGGDLGLIALSFLGFGLLLSFTPCVLPMVPILSGIIVGHGEDISRGRAFALSLAYVLGMAATYTVAGVLAGLSGTLLAAAFQNIWVLAAFAAFFVVLALGMFGWYEFQLPTALQSRLSGIVNKQGGSLGGLAGMGALSALIVGPCVAAPLAGALLYIAQAGSPTIGGAALFAMAIGMGIPLLAVGVAARHWLPKPGPWMEGVKRFFGVLLLATAIWLVGPVLPAIVPMLLWAALLVLCGVLLGAFDALKPRAGTAAKLGKGFGILALVASATLLVGALSGSRDPLAPLSGLQGSTAQAHPQFERIKTVADLDARLQGASRPVMLDFYADWCVSCKEMERFTFADAAVAKQLEGFTLLQADVTANDDADQALLKRFGLFGPPGIIFFDAQGREVDGLRVIGFMGATRFGQVLDEATTAQGGKR
ncbi:protein-disulfide reductase DsbD [Uliginosibacterium sp. H1]|uniref:protein-disulfide reductase DsbD n=1 Tax=Uliginosibacterium sp. H1 TaxID=3114757 RepID=UPI002E19EF5E|nr:protein-disulfide reductase DsbD [Uliginosibacterium sp. H1]